MRSDIFQEAKRRIDRRRMEHLTEQSRRMDEIAENLPEVSRIQRQLAMTSAEICKLILQKGEDLQAGIARIEKVNLDLQAREKELMTAAGYPADYLELTYTCPLCNDTGFVNGVRCRCLKEEMQRLSVAELNASSPLTKSRFEDFDLSFYPDTVDPATGQNPRLFMEKVLRYCRQYAEIFTSQSPGIFMYGETGLGKTHLSLAIAGKAAEKGYTVIYGSAQDLLRKVENEHFGRAENERTLDMMLEADLLVLDDLGAEFSSSFSQSVVYNLLNSRIASGKPMIVSSNLTIQEFNEKYSRRIVSRLFSQLVQIRFIGRDVRQLKRQREARG